MPISTSLNTALPLRCLSRSSQFLLHLMWVLTEMVTKKSALISLAQTRASASTRQNLEKLLPSRTSPLLSVRPPLMTTRLISPTLTLKDLPKKNLLKKLALPLAPSRRLPERPSKKNPSLRFSSTLVISLSSRTKLWSRINKQRESNSSTRTTRSILIHSSKTLPMRREPTKNLPPLCSKSLPSPKLFSKRLSKSSWTTPTCLWNFSTSVSAWSSQALSPPMNSPLKRLLNSLLHPTILLLSCSRTTTSTRWAKILWWCPSLSAQLLTTGYLSSTSSLRISSRAHCSLTRSTRTLQ